MNDRQWQHVWEIFRSAKDLPDGQRQRYLDSVSSDPEILREVAGMLEEPAEELLEEAPPEPASKTGTRFGRYEIGELLGSGGMGQVYAAQDTELARKVALKFLSPEMASNPRALQRLLREAKAVSALNHPHIVTVYEVTHAADDTAIAMELVEGEALRQYCGQPVEIAKVVDWGRQIAQALAAAHQGDIVHRDMKPENVMVRQDGILKVLDFGLARQAGGLGQANHSTAMLAGTLSYMAPEQIRGEGATDASDIFSLGIVLYELAAGRHPFSGASVIDTAHTIAHADIKRPSAWNARLPPEFDGLLLAMLHKDPKKRPSAVEVDRRLSQVDVTARPRPWRRMILAAAALATAVAGVWLFRFREQIFPPKDPVMTQVTTQVHENQVTAAAISPDGRSLAFAALGGAVYLRRMSDGFTRPLNTPAGLRVDRICWFGSQSKLLLSGSLEAGEVIEHYRPGVWVMPLNGDAVKVIDNGRDAVPSPDGARIAFTGADQSTIWVSQENGEDRRQLADGGRTSIFDALFWSPDGKRITFGRQDYTSNAGLQAESNYLAHWNYRNSYQSVEVDTGRVTAKTDDIMMTSACGLPDGRVFFLRSISIETLPANQMWEMRTDPGTGRPLGPPRQVTHLQAAMLASISASNNGRDVVATLVDNGYPNIYVADLSSAGPPERRVPRLSNIRRLTYTTAADYPHAWSADNQSVIFESSPNSHFDLFRQRIDRPDREPLVVSEDMKVMAQMTPDRQWLLYHQSAGPGYWKVMRVRPQGGTPAAVLPQGAKVEFRCGLQRGARCVLRTIDGNQYVFYELDAIRGKGRELARTALTASIVGDWDVSPDGSQVAIPIHNADQAQIRLLKLDPQGGPGRETTVSLHGLRNLSGVVWTADGRGWFVVSRAEHGWILSYADAHGNSSDLLEATGQTFAVPSPDGRHLAFPLWNESFNAWLFRGM